MANKGHRRGSVVEGRFGRTRWTDRSAYAPDPPAKRAKGWSVFVPLWAAAALGGTAYGAGWLDGIFKRPAAQFATLEGPSGSSFGYCHTGGGTNCVVDGDTLWSDGVKIRIADIDAPETHDFRCPAEKALGDRATARLHDLLESGPVELQAIDRDADRYGRKLRIVSVNGVSVGKTLVSEGLARWYGNGRQPWC